MIELVMFFALGFLAASLIALVLLSAVWHRAVRLTTKRIEGAIPVSMAEIQADKDQLRAEFAMSTRRLETSVDQLKLKTTEQFAEIGRKNDTIRRLKTATEQKTAEIEALEAQERTLKQRLSSTEEELSLKSRELHATESELARKATEIAQLARSLADKTAESDSRHVQIAALELQCLNLKDRITDLEGETRRQAELAGQREADLSARLAQKQAELMEANATIENSRAEALSLHREIENTTRSYNATVEALKGEKSMNEGALAQVRLDRDRLQQELEALKQQTESNWSNERVEGALLRERINDVAAEVVRLAANLEGTNSPIQRILDQPSPTQPNGGGSATGTAETNGGAPLTLADRIRALQRTRG
jgi:chromosome segregation ATPase